MFKKYKEKRRLKRMNDLNEWYCKGIYMVRNFHSDAIWIYIKDSIDFRSAELQYGGLKNCYATIITNSYIGIYAKSFHRIDTLLDMLKKIYRYKLEQIK